MSRRTSTGTSTFLALDIRMPKSARVLRFPHRRAAAVPLSAEDAILAATCYLDVPAEDRTPHLINESLSSPDVLTAVLRLLRENGERQPARAADEAARIYRWLMNTERVGLFDERDYFVGEAAFTAGNACRLLGNREDAFRWLDRAEAGFRHTVNAAPGLSNVAYARLGLRFEMGRYEDIIDLMPSLIESFGKLKMLAEAAKAELVFAMALKNVGRRSEALAGLTKVLDGDSVKGHPAIRARILAEYGDVLQLDGRFDEAMTAYQQALPLLEGGCASIARADLKLFVAAAYRAKGDSETALSGFRSAAADYRELGLSTRLAYLNVVTAETLLSLDRSREAEWEILQALPTIEEQKMVPEGFAAVALLRESVKRRKTDPNALRELREHLQKQN